MNRLKIPDTHNRRSTNVTIDFVYFSVNVMSFGENTLRFRFQGRTNLCYFANFTLISDIDKLTQNLHSSV